MGVVNLGSIKNAPISKLYTVQKKWAGESSGGRIKLDVPFEFNKNKTYVVFIRSVSGSVTIENNEVAVAAIDILTNDLLGVVLSGGKVFTGVGSNVAFGITFPNEGVGGYGIHIAKPGSTGVASIFNVGVFEL